MLIEKYCSMLTKGHQIKTYAKTCPSEIKTLKEIEIYQSSKKLYTLTASSFPDYILLVIMTNIFL